MQPKRSNDVTADRGLGKSIQAVLPPGWVVVALATDDDADPTYEQRAADMDSGQRRKSQPRFRTRVRGWLSRRPAPAPTILIVAPEVHADPASAVRAIANRQYANGAFRAALLAPPDWETAASDHEIRFESLIPETTWLAIYGSGWREYLQRRMRDAGAQFRPTAVVFAENFASDAAVALDVIDAAADSTGS